MKPGDLVRMKSDDMIGIVISFNASAEPSIDRCWYVFMTEYGTLPFWEHELEVLSESR